MSELLKKVYDPQLFRESGHELVDLIANHLENSLNQKIETNNYLDPESQLNFWRNYTQGKDGISGFYKKVVEDSIHLHHPKYMGHQISPPAPLAALTALVTDIMNNGMGVYEMGGPSTAIEKVVIETIAKAIGYDKTSDGFLTSGGTLANLTALLTARAQLKDRHIWTEGTGNKRLGLMVSEQAHYCVDRAVKIMGLGADGIVKVPVNDKFQMRADLLGEYYNNTVEKGIEIFAIVGSACTTSTGSYDNLNAIAQFASDKKIWFHIDGAHGGAVVFSEKYKHLAAGIEKADSVIIDCHKMMMTPSVTTAVVYKKGQDSFSTFAQNANYLFEKNLDREWHNLAKRTFECTKLMMGVKFYTLIISYGIKVIDDFVTTLHDNARILADMILKDPELELAKYPESNIVCYRILNKGMTDFELNKLNTSIRKRILEKGEFYIVQTILNGNVYLRNTMMNPFTSQKEMVGLISNIKQLKNNY